MVLICSKEHKPTILPLRHGFTVSEKLESIIRFSLQEAVAVPILELQYVINMQLTN